MLSDKESDELWPSKLFMVGQKTCEYSRYCSGAEVATSEKILGEHEEVINNI